MSERVNKLCPGFRRLLRDDSSLATELESWTATASSTVVQAGFEAEGEPTNELFGVAVSDIDSALVNESPSLARGRQLEVFGAQMLVMASGLAIISSSALVGRGSTLGSSTPLIRARFARNDGLKRKIMPSLPLRHLAARRLSRQASNGGSTMTSSSPAMEYE